MCKRTIILAGVAILAVAIVVVLLARSTSPERRLRNELGKIDRDEQAIKALVDEVGTKPLIAALSLDDAPNVRQCAASILGDLKCADAVEALISALRHDSESTVRRAAARALGQIGDRRAVPALIAALQQDRDTAAAALGAIGDSRAVEPLISVLAKHRSSPVVVRVLAQIDGHRAVDPLIQALSFEHWKTRCAAAEELGRIADPRSVEALIEALNRGRLCDGGVAALVTIGDDRAIPALIAGDDDDWDQVQQSLDKFGDTAVVPLVAALDTKNDLVRRRASEALVQMGSVAAPGLISSLTHTNEDVRGAAALTLGRIADVRAVQPLIAALEDPEPQVIQLAVEALSSLRDRRAVEPLIRVLTHESGIVRRQAVEALGDLGDLRAVKPLIARLTDRHINNAVARSLEKLSWKPGSQRERVYYLVAMRDADALKAESNWPSVKQVWLEDIQSGQKPRIEFALHAFTGIGHDEALADLLQIIRTKGNKPIAQAYLNCNQPELRAAANAWAERHGYVIMPTEGYVETWNWGGW